METSSGFFDYENSSSWTEDTPGGLLTDNPFLGVPTAVILCLLCLMTFFGNAVVLHAIRTERRLQTSVAKVFEKFLANGSHREEFTFKKPL
ncbi:hypothetical protein AVEN_250811-1 [Araneus ventricosus]|uniref:Uncharacterized protein n=1 Tax=Araneus ventricosus TaxID=182803 RepID=A0A4Y2MQZ9_ARAVE|nr:hypothetical protein AVEN_250811-1 [Araneus ventricosus]